MEHSTVFLSCALLLLLFALLGLKVWGQHRRGVHHAPLTPGSCALGLVYVLLIGTVAANALEWRRPEFWLEPLFVARWTVWVGGGLGILGLLGVFVCLRSLGDAFRLGAVGQPSDRLMTTGVYGRSRNPFFCALFVWYGGMFLILPCVGMGLVCLLFVLLVHAQTLQEEQALRHSSGAAYAAYCGRVPRYLSFSSLTARRHGL